MPAPDNPQAPAEMKEAIQSFDEATVTIVNSFARKLDEKPPPSTIFHYTDDIGLRGIIESGTLRLTDIFYLNDPSEVRHGCSPAIELLASALNDALPEIKQFSSNVRSRLHDGIEQAAHFFTLSFSMDGNDLGQWRSYADNGRGYAIGFDTHTLEQAFVKTRSNCMTFPVCYSEVNLRIMHKQIVDLVLPLIPLPRERNLTSEAVTNFMEELLRLFLLSVTQAALFFKHKAYSNEQEYRFLELFPADSPAPDIKYRSRPYSLIRYREFDWRSVVPGSLKKIVLGPAADPEKAERFARDCLRVYHVGDVRGARASGEGPVSRRY